MLLLITSDWHITDKVPVRRTDDYTELQYEKVAWILNNNIHHDLVLHGGDLTDSPHIPYAVTQRYINLLKNGRLIVTVFGQHDLRYHTMRTKYNTALSTLDAADIVTIANAEYREWSAEGQNIHIYGASFNEKIPKPTYVNSHTFNILITHRLVSLNDEWHNHVAFDNAKSLLANYTDYDLIVCGDNHKQFYTRTLGHGGKARFLVNPGSLMRSSIKQINHEPSVYLFNTVNRMLYRNPIPIKPWQEVSVMQETAQQDNGNKEEQLEELVEFLMSERSRTISNLEFIEKLRTIMHADEAHPDVIQLAEKFIVELQRSRPGATHND